MHKDNKKPKVAFIAPILFPGDRANTIQIVRMCEAVSHAGMETRLYYLRKRSNLSRAERRTELFQWYGVQTPFGCNSTLAFPNNAYTSNALLNRYILPRAVLPAARMATLIKSIMWNANLYVCRWWRQAKIISRLNLPIVYEFHDWPESPIWLKRGGFAQIRGWTEKHPNMTIVCTSETAKEALVKETGINPESLPVLGNAVKKPSPMTKHDARKAVGLNPDEPLVMYTGQLMVGKGVELLIEIARYLRSGVKVVIVGASPVDEAHVKNSYANFPDNIINIGHIPPGQVHIFQSAADILVLPQTSEVYNSPLKLYEYASAHRPIVATDIKPLRKILKHEYNALLAEPQSPKKLALSIERLLSDDDLAKNLADNALMTLSSQTWEKRSHELLKITGLIQDREHSEDN